MAKSSFASVFIRLSITFEMNHPESAVVCGQKSQVYQHTHESNITKEDVN